MTPEQMFIATASVLAALIVSISAASPPCFQTCPSDCGQRRRADGCLDCLCGSNFNGRPPRQSSCHEPCPSDCGQTTDAQGCNVCACMNPFEKPVPTPPSRSRRQQQDLRKCLLRCPADCGCTLDTSGEPQCHCKSGPNHPLIPPSRPPTPCRTECKSPCQFQRIPGETCRICVCPL